MKINIKKRNILLEQPATPSAKKKKPEEEESKPEGGEESKALSDEEAEQKKAIEAGVAAALKQMGPKKPQWGKQPVTKEILRQFLTYGPNGNLPYTQLVGAINTFLKDEKLKSGDLFPILTAGEEGFAREIQRVTTNQDPAYAKKLLKIIYKTANSFQMVTCSLAHLHTLCQLIINKNSKEQSLTPGLEAMYVRFYGETIREWNIPTCEDFASVASSGAGRERPDDDGNDDDGNDDDGEIIPPAQDCEPPLVPDPETGKCVKPGKSTTLQLNLPAIVVFDDDHPSVFRINWRKKDKVKAHIDIFKAAQDAIIVGKGTSPKSDQLKGTEKTIYKDIWPRVTFGQLAKKALSKKGHEPYFAIDASIISDLGGDEIKPDAGSESYEQRLQQAGLGAGNAEKITKAIFIKMLRKKGKLSIKQAINVLNALSPFKGQPQTKSSEEKKELVIKWLKIYGLVVGEEKTKTSPRRKRGLEEMIRSPNSTRLTKLATNRIVEILNIRATKKLINDFYPYAKEKLNINKPVKVQFKIDYENAGDPMGKTGYYDPDGQIIGLYTADRHPKDILRSFAHELTHHAQNCRGDLDGFVGEQGYAQTSVGNNLESEAYMGSKMVRDWEDTRKTAQLGENTRMNREKYVKIRGTGTDIAAMDPESKNILRKFGLSDDIKQKIGELISFMASQGYKFEKRRKPFPLIFAPYKPSMGIHIFIVNHPWKEGEGFWTVLYTSRTTKQTKRFSSFAKLMEFMNKNMDLFFGEDVLMNEGEKTMNENDFKKAINSLIQEVLDELEETEEENFDADSDNVTNNTDLPENSEIVDQALEENENNENLSEDEETLEEISPVPTPTPKRDEESEEEESEEEESEEEESEEEPLEEWHNDRLYEALRKKWTK